MDSQLFGGLWKAVRRAVGGTNRRGGGAGSGLGVSGRTVAVQTHPIARTRGRIQRRQQIRGSQPIQMPFSAAIEGSCIAIWTALDCAVKVWYDVKDAAAAVDTVASAVEISPDIATEHQAFSVFIVPLERGLTLMRIERLYHYIGRKDIASYTLLIRSEEGSPSTIEAQFALLGSREEVRMFESERCCLACGEEAAVVAVPCGHVVACRRCANLFGPSCPTCGSPVRARLFLAPSLKHKH